MRTTLLVTVGGALLLFWIVGPDANPSGASRLLDSFLVTAPIVALLRVTLRVRSRTRIGGGSAIDASGVQPGETTTIRRQRGLAGQKQLAPRCLEIEAMITSAISDPDFYAKEVQPYLVRTTNSSSWRNLNISPAARRSIGKRRVQRANRLRIRGQLDQLKVGRL